LGDAIGSLLDDTARREKLGRIGAERLRTELNWDRSVTQLVAAYQRALGTNVEIKG